MRIINVRREIEDNKEDIKIEGRNRRIKLREINRKMDSEERNKRRRSNNDEEKVKCEGSGKKKREGIEKGIMDV